MRGSNPVVLRASGKGLMFLSTLSVVGLPAVALSSARPAWAACGGNCPGTELVVHGLYVLRSDEAYTCVSVCSDGWLKTGSYALTVTGGGGLTIDAGGILEVDGASGEVVLTGGGTHTIDGQMILDANGSMLSISSNSVTLGTTGAGSIEGKHNCAEISIASTKRLTSDIEIKGNLEITGRGHFRNSNKVHASRSGTLNLNVGGTLDDDASTDQWIVDVAGAELRFSASANLLGKIKVAAGTLDVRDAKSVCTTGTVEHSGGSIVLNGNGANPEGSFGRSSSCPL